MGSERPRMESTLRDWQKEALKEWITAGKKGTAKAATGVGKTLLGIASMEKIGTISYGKDGVLIAVPTIFLQKQWKKELIKEGYNEEDIGFLGGGEEELERPILIGVVNSLRKFAFKKKHLILDEVHRYGSEQNFKFIANGSFDNILGFSATPEREDGKHEKLLEIAPMFYDIDQKTGVDAGILSPFDLVNIGVEFSPDKTKEYERLDRYIRTNISAYGGFGNIRGACSRGDTIASDTLKAISQRRQMLLKADIKVDVVPRIIGGESTYDHIPKTLVFCEYIEMSEKVKDELEEHGYMVAIYHSGMNGKKREQILEDFKSDKYDIMITAKCLDEGVDVPDCELGIILGGSKIERQMIQRLGRILRHRPGKKAKMYQVYIMGTKDVDWLNSRSADLAKAAEKVTWETM